MSDSAPASPDTQIKPVRVLVVTDDDLVRHEVRWGFPTGIDVDVAGDSREAWAMMQSVVPSIAVIDIQTGSAGGFGLARDMAQTEALAAVPILMLLERDQDSWLAGQAGATRYRTKPLDTIDLVREALGLLPG
ncbi:MAG: response regulator transcription factor [Actinobacteria bacterium]|nr:response regulator transcription factor [Actinomycetota bacterium]